MAGYKITFDGSLNERRDVAQVTSASSLVENGVISASYWDNITSGWPSAYIGSTPLPDIYISHKPSSNPPAPSISYSGGNVIINSASTGFGGIYLDAITPYLPVGTYGWEVRIRDQNSSGGTTLEVIRQSGSRVGFGVPTTSLHGPVAIPSAFTVISGTASINAGSEWFGFRLNKANLSAITEIDYIRITSPTGVSIFPATNVEGVAPAGGASSSPNIFTTTNGQSGIVGPAKLFGAKVIHDMNEIAEAKYYPPADSNQDAQLSMSETEIITATSTSLSVESEGLGGSDKLTSGSTSVIVEELLGAVEN